MITALLAGALTLAAAQGDGGSMAAIGEAMDAWTMCTATRVRHHALTTQEPAQTVVDAAIGECRERFLDIRDALFDMDLTVDETIKTLDSLLAHFRPTLVAGVLNLRESSSP